MELKGKRALITGGSRGLGKAIALALAKEGVHIAITGKNVETLKKAQLEIEALGVECAVCSFDVAIENEVIAALNHLIKRFGTFDILVNNAGIAGFGSLTEMTSTEWLQIIQTNLFGTYFVSKKLLPDFIEKQDGHIFNIASTAGVKANANTSAYSASKAAVIALSEAMMYEMRKQNVKVTTLNPSTVATDMSMTDLKITDGNPEKVLQPEDLGLLIVDILQMKSRALLTQATLFSTNP